MNSLNNSLLNNPDLLAGMSHEMRTHMNAIVAFSFLMREKNNNSKNENEEFSNQILNTCNQLIGLFETFIDSAMIDASNSKTELKICRFNNILDDLLSEFREEIRRNDQNNLEIISEIQFHNSTEISIDRARVVRVIRCLFQNSLRNTKSGYIKIGYYFQDNKATFYVLDSGQGYFKIKDFLQNEDLSESFTKYTDPYTAITTNLVKNLIKMMGGTIWIECNGLTGAGIYFSVPANLISNPNIKINELNNSSIAI
jgi:K+-sensing histidine kinase KdpD